MTVRCSTARDVWKNRPSKAANGNETGRHGRRRQRDSCPSKTWKEVVDEGCISFRQNRRSPLSQPGLCSTRESWVKFESTLTQMSRVRVESAVKIKDMSRVRVESRWSSFESELSQLDTAWVNVESLIFLKRKRRDLAFICNLTEPYSYIRPPPPPVNNFLPN